MADIIEQEHMDRKAIGRQISLPLTKAFEIAWKGIRIRLWRSLITMSGIILAIAFLMSVWTSDVFTKAMRGIEPTDSRYSLVQGVLEAQAIASGSVNLRVLVIEPSDIAGRDGVPSVGKAMETMFSGNSAANASLSPDTAEAITGPISHAKVAKRPDALVFVGFPESLNDEAVGNALKTYIEDGGFVLFYGSRGLEGVQADSAAAGLLPAKPADGDPVRMGGKELSANPDISISGINGQVHPDATLAPTTPVEGAVAAASAGDDAVIWWRRFGSSGATAWYPLADGEGIDTNVVTWFVTGHANGTDGGQAASLLARTVTRGAGSTASAEETSDTRGVWLVTLSLMVCVVGITNAMLMSVTERFREIGTMKCLGALDSFIVKLFLIESSLQGVVGSTLGALIGFGLAFTRALFTFKAQDLSSGKVHWLSIELFPVISLLTWMGIAIMVGIILAVVAAIYPATRAAKMAPVEAMRSEA